MIVVKQNLEDFEVFEFQGEFENIELYNGEFNPDTLQVNFTGFFLQGRRIQKEFTIFEVLEGDITVLKHIRNVILFDKPPRYNLLVKKIETKPRQLGFTNSKHS